MKHLLILLFLLCATSISAQDVIVKKDGSTVVCRVVEVTATEITYKKWEDLKGSNYVMDKSLVSTINYESGRKETFSETESLYKPHNQNDGTRQYNDVALLGIDREFHPKWKRKFKWNLYAGYSYSILTSDCHEVFDNVGLDCKLKSGSGFDLGIGIVFPMKDKNMFIGGDIGYTYSSLEIGDLADGHLNSFYIKPYWGYKLSNGRIAPYVGLYGGMLSTADLFISDIETTDYKIRVVCDDWVIQYGCCLGVKMFLSSQFYFDFNTKICLSNQNVWTMKMNHDYSKRGEKNEKNPNMFKLSLGIGVQF